MVLAARPAEGAQTGRQGPTACCIPPEHLGVQSPKPKLQALNPRAQARVDHRSRVGAGEMGRWERWPAWVVTAAYTCSRAEQVHLVSWTQLAPQGPSTERRVPTGRCRGALQVGTPSREQPEQPLYLCLRLPPKVGTDPDLVSGCPGLWPRSASYSCDCGQSSQSCKPLSPPSSGKDYCMYLLGLLQ